MSKVISGILQKTSKVETATIEIVGTEMVSFLAIQDTLLQLTPKNITHSFNIHFQTIHINKLDSLIPRTGYTTTIREDTSMSRCIKMYLESETIKAYATDGRRMVVAEADSVSDGEFEAVIPEDTLRTLYSLTSAKEDFFMGKTGAYAIIFNADTILDFLRTATGPLHLFIDKSGLLILMANQTKYAVVPRRAATAVAPPEHASAKRKKTKAKTMSHAA